MSNVQQENERVALKKTHYFARMEKMAPVFIQIQGIEEKALELNERNELEASIAAATLADKIRKEIIKFAESEEDEQLAFASF